MAGRNVARTTPPTLAQIVGSNIRRARDAAGLTQHQLAVALERGDGMTISRWERGENKPADDSLVALAQLLGRDPGWFYTDHKKQAA